MIKEIAKKLEAGETVGLECIDRDEFLNCADRLCYEQNKVLLKSNLEVERVVDEDDCKSIFIKDCNFLICEDEFQYFKIKEDDQPSVNKMIEEIRRRLEAGEIVKLECTDERGYGRIKDGLIAYDDLSSDDLKYFKIKEEQDEVDQLIESRSSDSYRDISEDAGEIISTLGDDVRFNYFFSQIANKLARIKHRYSVEDSLIDIAGYAKLELQKLREDA